MTESAPRPDLRLLVPAAVAWAATGATLGLPVQHRWGLVLGAVVLGFALAGGRRWLSAACCLVAAMAAASTGLRVDALRTGPIAELAQERAMVTVQVVLTSDVRLIPRDGVRPEVAVAPARVVRLDARGRAWQVRQSVELRASGEAARWLTALPASATVVVSGRLAAPQVADPLAAVLQVREPPRVVRGPAGFGAAINQLRAGLVRAASGNSPEQAGLLPSLVVGDTSRLPPEVVEQFKATGLTHLTAVSGANLVLVLSFVTPVLVLAGARGLVLRGVQTAVVLGFVVLCRAEPSVVRAAAMGLVALSALGRARDPARGLRHLAVAVLVLMVVDPWLARSWGFALSASATGGLLLWAGRWQRAMAWAPGWVQEAVAVPLAAQLATQPLVGALSGTVSVVGIVANAVAGPFVGPATVIGFLAAVTSPLPGPLSRWLGWFGGWCVEPLLVIARVGSQMPGATRPWPATPLGLLVLTAGSLLVGVVAGWVLARRWLVIALAAALVVALSRAPATPGWPGDWQVVFCSVGQGDATVLRAGPRAAVLVDTGPDERGVRDCLQQLGVTRVPLLVLTHYHDDHVGGFEEVVGRFDVDTILVSPLRSPAVAAQRVDAVAARHGAHVAEASGPATMVVGAVSLRVVRAGPLDTSAWLGGGVESSAENDASIITVATVGDLSVMLPGDAEPAALRAAVASGESLEATVIKMPHHGSSRQDRPFWQQTGASLAVASAGVDNDYGHPAKAALDLARQLGMEVARTDRQGSLAVTRRDGRLRVVGNGISPRR